MGDEGLQGTGGRRDFERGSLCSRRRLRESELETTKPRTAEKSGESIVEELGALGVNGGGWKWGETRRRIKQRGGLPSYRRDPAKILAEISLCTVLGPFRRVFRPLSSLSLSFSFPFSVSPWPVFFVNFHSATMAEPTEYSISILFLLFYLASMSFFFL